MNSSPVTFADNRSPSEFGHYYSRPVPHIRATNHTNTFSLSFIYPFLGIAGRIRQFGISPWSFLNLLWSCIQWSKVTWNFCSLFYQYRLFLETFKVKLSRYPPIKQGMKCPKVRAKYGNAPQPLFLRFVLDCRISTIG